MSNQPTLLDEPVTIHFKENSIPGLRRGVLTEESKKALADYIQSVLVGELEKALYGRSPVEAYDYIMERVTLLSTIKVPLVVGGSSAAVEDKTRSKK